ncbi:hypothetical protein JW977_02545 [Candidatus Falkowbacteria bacterium]|nr:hypothetical protein [Candidatus Falkowbacteria bacterium]
MTFEKPMQKSEQTSKKKYTPEEILGIVSRTESESVINKAEYDLKNELERIKNDLKKIGKAKYLVEQLETVYKALDKIGEKRKEKLLGREPSVRVIKPGEILSKDEYEKMFEENEPKHEA